jgi:hypothetical protein
MPVSIHRACGEAVVCPACRSAAAIVSIAERPPSGPSVASWTPKFFRTSCSSGLKCISKVWDRDQPVELFGPRAIEP